MLRLLILLLLAGPALGEDLCSNVSCYPRVIEKDGTTFYLLGKSDFTYFLMDIYSIALYVDQKDFQGDVLDPELSKILHFKYHRKIEKKRLVDGAVETLQKNPNFRFEDFQNVVSEINQYYSDVMKGDQYILNYNPSQGLSLEDSKASLITLNNRKFAQYYLGIWLSEYPLSKRMRQELLGK